MALNDTPHRESPTHADYGKAKGAKAPKPKPVPMHEKVARLCMNLRQDPSERLLLAKGRWQYATSGRPISSAVVRRAYAEGKLVCLDEGGLFPGYKPSKTAPMIAGQSWKLAHGA